MSKTLYANAHLLNNKSKLVIEGKAYSPRTATRLSTAQIDEVVEILYRSREGGEYFLVIEETLRGQAQTIETKTLAILSLAEARKWARQHAPEVLKEVVDVEQFKSINSDTFSQRIDPMLKYQLQQIAKKRNLTFSALVSDILVEYVKNYK